MTVLKTKQPAGLIAGDDKRISILLFCFQQIYSFNMNVLYAIYTKVAQ